MDKRISKIISLLQKEHVECILISSSPLITYLTGYTGFSLIEREALLLITQKNPYILTDGRYSEAVAKHIPHFKLLEINSSVTFSSILKRIARMEKINTVGFDENHLTVAEYNMIKKVFAKIKHVSLKDIRIKKDQTEIKAITKACEIGDKAFHNILKQIKPAVTEKELAVKLEMYIKKQIADISFPPIVAFGENSAIPHHHASNKKLKKNEWVLLDFGVRLDNYCSDMTRTVFFDKPTRKQKKMYQTVLSAQQEAVKYIEGFLSSSSEALAKSRSNNGAMKQSNNLVKSSRLRSNRKLKALEVDKIARDYIISQGFPSIPHSLGHGIGIEVHEAPSLSPHSKYELTNGMVFSIEPGIYLPGKGGVRIEDLFAIQNNKLTKLTNSPKELTIL